MMNNNRIFISFIVLTIIVNILIISCKSDKKIILDANEVEMDFSIDSLFVKDAGLMISGLDNAADPSLAFQLKYGNKYLIKDKHNDLKNLIDRKWYQINASEEDVLIGFGQEFEYTAPRAGVYKIRLCYNNQEKCSERYINVSDNIVTNQEKVLSDDYFDDQIINTKSNNYESNYSNQSSSPQKESNRPPVSNKSIIIEDNSYNPDKKNNSSSQDKLKAEQLAMAEKRRQEDAENLRLQEELKRKEEEQKIAQDEKKVIKNPVSEPPKIEEKEKVSTPKFTKEGTVLQLNKESCITSQGHALSGGSMKLAASVPIRLRGASIYSNREGRCKFTLTGPQGQRGTKIASLNSGVNAIRFSEWPHLILNGGETWILEFEGQGGVELYELNDCVKTSGTELRPMNKIFLFNLNYYN